MSRAKKGTVSVYSRAGILRLRLPRTWFNGQLKFLNLKIPDTPVNRTVAGSKARSMEIDFVLGQFDFSLDKYKLKTSNSNKISFVELFEKYMEFKFKVLQPSSHHNLRTTFNKLKQMPESTLSSPKKIRLWLLENGTQEQARRNLMRINQCYEWALDNQLVPEPNPFSKLRKIKKVSDPRKDPFTVNERDMIISAFERDEPFFADFVKFLFFTGCRPSEAAGLRWQNVDLLQGKIIFCEGAIDGKQKQGTKTGKDRIFPINQQLKSLLKGRKRDYEHVFVSEKGKLISPHNFLNRKWKPVLKNILVRYRPTYTCRSTFISCCLEEGKRVDEVASWVGNSPDVLLKHYAGLINKSEVPNL